MIPIQNIYYMLSYAFSVLNEQGYKEFATEKFDDAADLLSAILVKGVSIQIKCGLMKDYVLCNDTLSAPKGKIEISSSVRTGVIFRHKLDCSYDEFTVDCMPNRIIKSTMLVLLKSDISKKRKQDMRKILVYLDEVQSVSLRELKWDLTYDRNNRSYEMLIAICDMIINGLIQNTDNGRMKMLDFLDEQAMHKLYERFILEYYRKNNCHKLTVGASQIPWAIKEGSSIMMPAMKSDIMLTNGDRTLIIDAKYYAHTTQQQFGKHTIHSHNLYQIFTYVKNYDKDNSGKVSGMLLYAKTDEQITPDESVVICGNRISVRTLDLNCSFDKIKEQLDSIAMDVLC